jgi:hypothetical protein
MSSAVITYVLLVASVFIFVANSKLLHDITRLRKEAKRNLDRTEEAVEEIQEFLEILIALENAEPISGKDKQRVDRIVNKAVKATRERKKQSEPKPKITRII